jgi:hypothetical protein
MQLPWLLQITYRARARARCSSLSLWATACAKWLRGDGPMAASHWPPALLHSTTTPPSTDGGSGLNQHRPGLLGRPPTREVSKGSVATPTKAHFLTARTGRSLDGPRCVLSRPLLAVRREGDRLALGEPSGTGDVQSSESGPDRNQPVNSRAQFPPPSGCEQLHPSGRSAAAVRHALSTRGPRERARLRRRPRVGARASCPIQ